jgi:hypothetical protein
VMSSAASMVLRIRSSSNCCAVVSSIGVQHLNQR